MSSQSPTGTPPVTGLPGRDDTYVLYDISCTDGGRSSPDPKRPRLNVPLPGPAPYSVPVNYSNNTTSTTSSPQIMGPPSIRLQTGLYPSQSSVPGSNIRPAPTLSMPPPSSIAPPQPEDLPQDAEQLQDALASAGVDLKAEEFNLSQLLTPSSTTTPQPPPFMFPHTYNTTTQVQQQLDEGALIFNRLGLSRLVDKIGISII